MGSWHQGINYGAADLSYRHFLQKAKANKPWTSFLIAIYL
jgi:hypothetical protein